MGGASGSNKTIRSSLCCEMELQCTSTYETRANHPFEAIQLKRLQVTSMSQENEEHCLCSPLTVKHSPSVLSLLKGNLESPVSIRPFQITCDLNVVGGACASRKG